MHTQGGPVPASDRFRAYLRENRQSWTSARAIIAGMLDGGAPVEHVDAEIELVVRSTTGPPA